MKRSFFVGACSLLVILTGVALLWPDNNEIPHTIAVSGECLTTAPRDKTAITLRVTALADSAAQSMRDATSQMAEITEYLKTLPVQLQTTQFNSYEKTEWNRDEQRSVTLGIETTIAVEVSANSVDEIEQILSQFANKQNVYSENLRMYTSPEVLKPIMEQCLSVAVENARTRANALASGDNKRAGELISVSYNTSANDSVAPTNGLLRTKMVMAASVADTSATGTIVSRDTDVSVSVSAVFEIK
ncbi:MAG: SIMPL domain-containing protein [Alphaproteobacteria bacterium]|nr:SIMPL domain-containing protein [Alphaproteobacteria bacterium]